MPSRKRNLEKVERVANSTHAARSESHGEAANYLRELIAKAERGELPKVKPATEEKRSETWLESEVVKIANRLQHRVQTEGANSMVRAVTVANQTGADTEPTDALLARILRKTNKVH
jgi:hypothetical protein